MITKSKLKDKALIKDLEKQIDYLITYSPQGLHWKAEYYFREELITQTLNNAPDDICDKLNRLINKVYELRSDNTIDEKQPYLKYADSLIYEKKTHKMIVNDRMTGKSWETEI